jgi:hypothetical protein
MSIDCPKQQLAELWPRAQDFEQILMVSEVWSEKCAARISLFFLLIGLVQLVMRKTQAPSPKAAATLTLDDAIRLAETNEPLIGCGR